MTIFEMILVAVVLLCICIALLSLTVFIITDIVWTHKERKNK